MDDRIGFLEPFQYIVQTRAGPQQIETGQNEMAA